MRWDEAAAELPTGWAWTRFADVAETQLGKMLSKASKVGHDPRPYLRNQNVQWGRIDLSDVATMDFTEAEMAKYSLRAGDLVVCEGGEVGRAAVWPETAPECFFQKAIHRVRPCAEVDASYVRYALEAMARSGHLTPFTSGSTIKHLPQEDLRVLPLPLAPSLEQRRIVDELERRLSHVDAAVIGMRAVKRRLSATRRALLLQSVGEDWPDHWKSAVVAEAGDTKLGLQRSPSRHVGTNMKPYLRVANVFEARVDLTDVKAMHFTAEEAQRYRLRAGDILLNEGQTPELLGRSAMWRDDQEEMYFTNSLIRFRAAENVLPEWALLVFRRHMHAGRFRRESRITTNIAHLALGRFRTVEFPIPSLEEQEAIVAEVARRMSLIDAAERTISASLAKAEQLRRSLLAAAFSGRLVPQDPEDEHASVLLGRITAAGAAAAPTKSTRRKKKEVTA